jgi:two-component system, NarL family, sensor histidine kinase UhpB
MTTVEAPPSVTTHIAVITDDEESFCWIASLLASSPRTGYASEWLSDEAAVRRALEAERTEVLLLDGRAPGGLGRSVLAALGERGKPGAVPAVLLTAENEEDDLLETLPAAHLTAAALDRALRRAQRQAAVVAELRQLRRERDVRAAAEAQVKRERDRQERLLQGIMQSLPILIGRLDGDGRVIETHGAGLTRCGLAPTVLRQRRLSVVLPQAKHAVRQAFEGETTTFSVRGRHGDEEWHADFVIMPDAGGEPGAIFLGRDVSERRWLEQQLLTATDGEQQRIGADLHDGLGQQLTGLACLVAALRDRLRSEQHSHLAAQADFIVQVANNATQQSRALARGLCPVQLEGATLQSALADLVYQAQQLHGISCRFRSRGELPPLDHFTAIHLYRITQEALHNAVRHGSARNVSVLLVSRGPRHRLTIMDDGCGFDTRQKPAIASRGLRLMQYRAGMIGGILSITSWPGRGTRVQCQFAHAPGPHEDHH